MSKGCELTEFEWGKIIDLWKGGYSERDIKDIERDVRHLIKIVKERMVL